MTTVAICQDLDAAVLQGLRLLHSADPDSEDQLYQLWKQCVYEKYGSDRTPTSVLHKINIPSGLKREGVTEPADDSVAGPKKSKLDSSTQLFHKPTPGSPSSNAGSSYFSDDLEVNNRGSHDDSDSDTPLEMFNGDGTCMKCKKSSFNYDNKLVECVDCHKYYHQQCHFPPITDMDLSDPRFVWYCSTCEESITTTTSNDRNKNAGNSNSGSNKSLNTTTSSVKSSSLPTTKNSSRSYGSSLPTNRSSSSTTGSHTSSSSGSKSTSKITSSSNSSSSHDKKNGSQSSHVMKKRPLKKPDKKKSGK